MFALTPVSAPAPGGELEIQSSINHAKCMAVSAGSINNAATLNVWDCLGVYQKNQLWTLQQVGNGYNIVSVNSGKCIDINADLSPNGTPITQYECLGASQTSQIWELVPNPNGYFQLKSRLTGNCIDLSAGNTTDGTNFQEWSCYSPGTNPNQMFQLAAAALGQPLSNENFSVDNYHASGSMQSISCSGSIESTSLNCSSASDFTVGEGVRIISGGAAPAVAPVKTAPVIYTSSGMSGTHTRCYVVVVADQLEGMSAASPPTCLSNQSATLDYTHANALNTTVPLTSLGPAAIGLWYSSLDGGAYQMAAITGFSDTVNDMGMGNYDRGWPSTLPSTSTTAAMRAQDFYSIISAVNGSQITIENPLVENVSNLTLTHDDSDAIEAAITAASVSGGNVLLSAKTYPVRRPAVTADGSNFYSQMTRNLIGQPWWAGTTKLWIPNGSAGNVHIMGQGTSTVLVDYPDKGGSSTLIQIGGFDRPAYAPYIALNIQPMNKGDTSTTFVNPSDAAKFQAGDDIWFYASSFGYKPGKIVNAADGSSGGQDHLSELNSVTAVNTTTGVVTLAYPMHIKIYQDAEGSSFGAVKMPVTPHNVSLQNFNIEALQNITGSGLVYDLLIGHVNVIGNLDHGAWGGGFKRNFTIQNSSWTIGVGNDSWGQNMEEYDQIMDVTFNNDVVSGYAPYGPEGPSDGPRIGPTEGTSGITVTNCTFNKASFITQQTNSVVVTRNTFNDGDIAVGTAYHNGGDNSYLNIYGQTSATVEDNTVNISSSSDVPWAIGVGHFDQTFVGENVINYSGKSDGNWILSVVAGIIKNNTVNISSANGARGIVAFPDDVSSPYSTPDIVIENNTVTNTPGTLYGIEIRDPGLAYVGKLCIQNNTFLGNTNLTTLIDNKTDMPNQSCSGY